MRTKMAATNFSGLIATSMTRSASGLVTVTEANHGYANGDTIWIGGTTPANFNVAQEAVTNVQVVSSTSTLTIYGEQQPSCGDASHVSRFGRSDFSERSDGHGHGRNADKFHCDTLRMRTTDRRAETAGHSESSGSRGAECDDQHISVSDFGCGCREVRRLRGRW